MSERDIVSEWLQIAYDDYDSAKYLYDNKRPNPVEIICYHCQQAVEKSLKAFMCANNLYIPRTHDTGLLCQSCADIDSDFLNFHESCEEIAVYATQTRYPIRVEIAESNVKRALQQASEIYNFVLEKTRNMGQPLG